LKKEAIDLKKIHFKLLKNSMIFYFFYSGRPPSDVAERALTEKRAKLEARVAGRQNHMNNINGVVLTLGQGDTGQLGLGPDIMERSKPALVKDLSRVKAVCAGGMHTVCLTKEGKVYTFGKLSIPFFFDLSI
jgi:hypothetical protein